jgi:hypothetical protein
MNPQHYLDVRNLRRTFLVAAMAFSAVVFANSGRAQGPVVTATLAGSNGSSTVNISSNQSFTLTLTLTTNFPSSGITYFFSSNLAGSGLFRIVSRDTTGSPYPVDPLVCTADACLLNPVNDFDLGGSNTGSDIDPAGTYIFATYTFNTMNAPVGQYTIFTDRGIVTDRTGGGFADRPFNALATINVVPEPGTVGLALLGGAVLSAAAWRRRSRA